jgi:hypothetical protein
MRILPDYHCWDVAVTRRLLSATHILLCLLLCPTATYVCATRPWVRIYALAANSVYSVPYLRHLTSWWGAAPATEANFKALLKRGNVAVIVGGIAGM